MGDSDLERQIGRQLALAGLALSQVAYLMDECGPIGMSDIRHTLAQRKVLALLSEAAHLAALLEMSSDATAARWTASRLRTVRSSAALPQSGVDDAGDGQKSALERKPLPADVERDELSWECSTLSSPYGVEVAEMSGGSVVLRDADDPDGPVLVASRWEWEAFALSVAASAFIQPR